jgi:hypothetical protein
MCNLSIVLACTVRSVLGGFGLQVFGHTDISNCVAFPFTPLSWQFTQPDVLYKVANGAQANPILLYDFASLSKKLGFSPIYSNLVVIIEIAAVIGVSEFVFKHVVITVGHGIGNL